MMTSSVSLIKKKKELNLKSYMQNMEIDLSPINFFSHHQCRVVIKVSEGFHQLHFSLFLFAVDNKEIILLVFKLSRSVHQTKNMLFTPWGISLCKVNPRNIRQGTFPYTVIFRHASIIRECSSKDLPTLT